MEETQKIINPVTGRKIVIGGSVFKRLLRDYNFIDGIFVIKHDYAEDIQKYFDEMKLMIAERDREIQILQEQVVMMQESHDAVNIIIKFNTIKHKLGSYVNFKYMEDNKNWSQLYKFLDDVNNVGTLTSIFGYRAPNFHKEYEFLRYHRNNLSHKTNIN